MTTIDFYLWLAIEGLGGVILVELLYRGLWRVMPWFTIMTISNLLTDIILPYIATSYPSSQYFWPYVASETLTMVLQLAAIMQLLFLRKSRLNSAAKMGLALLGVFLLEWAVMMRVAQTNLLGWYDLNHITQCVYVGVEGLWIYWIGKINKGVVENEHKEELRHV